MMIRSPITPALLAAFTVCVSLRSTIADDAPAIQAWTTRAEEYRSALEDVDEQAIVDVALAAIYARQGDKDNATACAWRLISSDSQVASSELFQVNMLLAEHLGSAANEVLRMIADPLQRDNDAKYFYMGYGARGDLESARAAQKLIHSDDARFEAWIGFVVTAMDPRIAREAMGELKPQSDVQRTRVQGLGKMLDRRAENQAKKPPTAEELWARAEESGDGAAWRAAAEAYRNEQNASKAKEALSKALAQVDRIEFESLRVGTLTLIAREYLELGDQKNAARVMKIAVKVMEESADDSDEDELFGFLNAVVVSPVFIAMLARSGELDLAIEWATPNHQFAALGAGCTSPKMQAELADDLTVSNPLATALSPVRVLRKAFWNCGRSEKAVMGGNG